MVCCNVPHGSVSTSSGRGAAAAAVTGWMVHCQWIQSFVEWKVKVFFLTQLGTFFVEDTMQTRFKIFQAISSKS